MLRDTCCRLKQPSYRLVLVFVGLATTAVLADDIKTTTGNEYKNVTVSRAEPDGLVVVASYGIIKIPFEELPSELRAKYGYNPAEAATFRRQTADAEAAVDRELQRQQKANSDVS